MARSDILDLNGEVVKQPQQLRTVKPEGLVQLAVTEAVEGVATISKNALTA